MCFVIKKDTSPELYQRFIDAGYEPYPQSYEEPFLDNKVFNIATEDIVCYKILKKQIDVDFGIQSTNYYSLYFHPGKWIIDELKEEKKFGFCIWKEDSIHGIKKEPNVSIGDSYHSYSSFEKAKSDLYNKDNDWEVIVKCIVPKGSYYLQCDGYIVSNKIIPKEINVRE